MRHRLALHTHLIIRDLSAACDIAGMVPIDILADKMSRLYQHRSGINSASAEIKRKEHAKSVAECQRRWETSTEGRWIGRLIPYLSKWVSRGHREITDYTHKDHHHKLKDHFKTPKDHIHKLIKSEGDPCVC